MDGLGDTSPLAPDDDLLSNRGFWHDLNAEFYNTGDSPIVCIQRALDGEELEEPTEQEILDEIEARIHANETT